MTSVNMPPPAAVDQLSDLLAALKNYENASDMLAELKSVTDANQAALQSLSEENFTRAEQIAKLEKQEAATDAKLKKLDADREKMKIEIDSFNAAQAQLAQDRADFDKIRAKVEDQMANEIREFETTRDEFVKASAKLVADQQATDNLKSILQAKLLALKALMADIDA